MVAMSVLGPLSIWRLWNAVGEASPLSRERAMTAACVLLTVQFIPLIYNVHVEKPHPHAARAHDALVDYIRGVRGHVIVVEHGYYTTLAGKGSGLQQIAIGDLERASGDALHRSDPHYLQKLFDPLRRGPGRPTLITDEALTDLDPLWASIAPGYKLTADLGDVTAPLATFGGHALAPRFVYSPVEPPAGADSSRGMAAALPVEANAHP
jgi:hypothetical protein